MTDVKTMAKKTLEELLPEGPENFPVGETVTVLRGKTLAKTGQWLKAILLTESGKKKQLRLYGWQKNKEGQYKNRQKFNISQGYMKMLSNILQAFLEEEK
jgi:hypothetical protein